MMAGRDMTGNNEFWSGEKISECFDVFVSLTPHLLLFFSVQRFQNGRKAKLKPKLIDPPPDADQESIFKPNLIDLPQDADADADQVNNLNPSLIDVSQETLENILGFKLMDLPQETIEKILMKLPTKLICSIRCASKTVSTIVDTPWFAAHHRSRLLNYSGMNSVSEVPQLMICYRSPDRGESFLQPLKYNGQHNLEKLDSYFLPVSKLVTRSICDLQFAFYNFLLFKERNPYGGPSILFNPLRGEVLKIPGRGTREPSDFKLPRDFYGMGFDSTSNTYKLVCVTFETALVLSPRHPETSPWTFPAVAHVYELGQSSSSWREIQAVPPDYLSPENVCAHGDMHWRVERKDDSKIRERSRIISFDFDKEEFCWTPHPTLSMGSNYFMFEHGHLLNLKGSLAIVDSSTRASISIWVMKNYEKKEWALDYKISLFPDKINLTHDSFGDFRCDEWNDGIFFVQKDDGRKFRYSPGVCCYFLDLKRNSMTRVEKPWRGIEKYILNCPGSLVSLKMFGSLVPETEANVWHCNKVSN